MNIVQKTYSEELHIKDYTNVYGGGELHQLPGYGYYSILPADPALPKKPDELNQQPPHTSILGG